MAAHLAAAGSDHHVLAGLGDAAHGGATGEATDESQMGARGVAYLHEPDAGVQHPIGHSAQRGPPVPGGCLAGTVRQLLQPVCVSDTRVLVFLSLFQNHHS